MLPRVLPMVTCMVTCMAMVRRGRGPAAVRSTEDVGLAPAQA